MKQQKIDWIIHVIASEEFCELCGKMEKNFPDYMANMHTHGMEKYGHLDFQIVLDIPSNVAGTILNDMGLRVQAGEKFKSGDVLSDILADGYDVHLLEVEETGRRVLRLLLPDPENRFPDDKDCQYPYNKQAKFKTK